MAQQNPAERVACELGAQFINGIQQQAAVTTLQDQLAKAQARIKELEEKK